MFGEPGSAGTQNPYAPIDHKHGNEGFAEDTHTHSDLQAKLPDLAANQVWLGPSATPTDLTKAEEFIVQGDPATTPPTPNKPILFWDGDIYTYAPKEFLRRDVQGSDFRRAGTNIWGGIVSARPPTTANVIYYTFTGYGIIPANNFSVGNGSGTELLTAQDAPASYAPYNSLEEALAGSNTAGTMIVLPTGAFVITAVLQPRWVLAATRNRLSYNKLPTGLANPGTESKPFSTLQGYSRVAYNATNFLRGAGLNEGQFMVGESAHAKQIVFRLREEDFAMHDYLEIGLGMGASTLDRKVVVSEETITAINLVGSNIIRLTLSEAGFTNFSADAVVILEAQSKIDRRLDAVETRVQSARDLAGTLNLNSDDYNIVNATLIGDATVGIIGGSDGDVFELRVTQDSTGGRTFTLAPTVQVNGSAPTIQAGASQRTILYFEYIVNAWYFRVAING